MASDQKRDYEVGYGKPPSRSRFKKGHSGNPHGRPRGANARVDAEEFTTTWMFAILLHGQGRRVDAKAIYETIAKLPPIAETS